MVPVAAVMIAGTGADTLIARHFYAQVARIFGQARILAIPGRGRGSIAESTSLVQEIITKEYGNAPIWVAGHSQGAVIAAAVGIALPHQILRVAAFSGPFNGVPLARWTKPASALAPSLRDMSPGSWYLAQLRRYLPELAPRLATLAFDDDRLVPWRSSYVAGATNYLVGSHQTWQAAQDEGLSVIHVLRTGHWTGGHVAGMFRLSDRVEELLRLSWENSQAA